MNIRLVMKYKQIVHRIVQIWILYSILQLMVNQYVLNNDDLILILILISTLFQITNSIDYEVKYSTQLHSDSLKTSGLSLRFILNDKHFYQGKLKLKCISSIPLYNIQNEANKIVKDYQYRHELLQYFSSSSSSSASSSASESQGLYVFQNIFPFSLSCSLLLLY